MLAPVLFVGGVLALQSTGAVAPVVGRGWADFDRTRWPVDLIPLLKDHEPRDGEPNRLFNSCVLGGFAIYHVPGYRVFIDDRVELFGEDFFEEFVLSETPERAAPALAEWQRKYGQFDFALVEPRGSFAVEFRRNAREWEPLGESPAAAFFRRRK